MTLGLVIELCLLFVLWGLSLAATYWDLERHGRSRAETLAWLVLVAVLPGLGLAAYLLSRLFASTFPLSPNAGLGSAGRRRVTQLRPQPARLARTGTIAATDL